MDKNAGRRERIRTAIIQSIPEHPRDLVKVISKRFAISRQATHKHIRVLLAEEQIVATGITSDREYTLKTLQEKRFSAQLAELEEDQLWREEASSTLQELPRNVVDIWHYVFTEMVNNAIDHSEGEIVTVVIERNALMVKMGVYDDGVGIFLKIKEAHSLEDERHAVLELAKGKLTTDPDTHTGEGIFFTSRMLDDFAILAGRAYFSHNQERDKDEDWILAANSDVRGTSVQMALNNHSRTTTKEVFNRFAAEEDDYGFTKTIVPVHFAAYGQENIVSRSQAKRLLARMEKFKTVVLDFHKVESVGRAFLDEIFRVFVNQNPSILVLPLNAPPQIQQAIDGIRASMQGPGKV